jgi:hypothetical protein
MSNERKYRYRIPSSFGRKSCPNCSGFTLYRYYEGPIDEYCYECSWKKMRLPPSMATKGVSAHPLHDERGALRLAIIDRLTKP